MTTSIMQIDDTAQAIKLYNVKILQEANIQFWWFSF